LRERGITPAECEDDEELCMHVKGMLAKKASEVRLRNKYLSRIPWAVSRADTVEGAKEFMKQLRSKDLEEHDPVTQWIARTHGGMIDARSRGEPCTEALQTLVDDYNLTKFDENVGEGYHRGASHELTRAPGSTTEHLKQDVRCDQETDRIERWTSAYGERGRQVVRFEWRNAKRLLQTEWANRWRKKQMSWKAFFFTCLP